MRRIECLISDNSEKYNVEILKAESLIIKESLNDYYLLRKISDNYREIYSNKLNEFNLLFKQLNEYHYEVRNAVKSISIDCSGDMSKDLLAKSQKDILNSLQDTFQQIVTNEEREVYTYKILSQLTSEYLWEGCVNR